MNTVSIIVTFHEQRSRLQALLNCLLSLKFEGEYEVIVVDKEHDKDTDEWLEQMEQQYPHLSHTFCPAVTRCIDIHRLALTLGAKAAYYDNLLLIPDDERWTMDDGRWATDDWLSPLLKSFDDHIDVVIAGVQRRKRWGWLTSPFSRRGFSVFQPTSSLILCHRNILLQANPIIPKERISSQPL